MVGQLLSLTVSQAASGELPMPGSVPSSLRLLRPLLLAAGCTLPLLLAAQEFKHSEKPPLHGSHWVAITGKPLAATAGAQIFMQGGNAVDAAAAMLAASATMWDTLGWGGETQALIHNPKDGKVYALNALGVAPETATVEYFRDQLGMAQPPEYGPLAAVTPGTPGGLLVMLAEFGSMSLEQVLAPSLTMAAGYPIEEVQVDTIESYKPLLRSWEYSRKVFLPHDNPANPRARAAPAPGELFRQPDLLATLQKLVAAEREALQAGKSRKEAILAAYDRFYRGDIAEELVRATQAAGGLITLRDLDRWQVYIEAPVMTRYKDIEVYKLDSWVQGPVLLQMLNLLEGMDVRGLGYNSPEYIHLLYQVMNLAFADRDFYYGDPYFPPEEPIQGLLSKDYARERARLINRSHNDPDLRPGDPYPFQNARNPFAKELQQWRPQLEDPALAAVQREPWQMSQDEARLAGTTSIQTVDAEGWMVSITPSGAWLPAFIAGNTGIGLSQRMQSFDFDAARNPFNVMEPGKRPRATLTPSIALRNGKPFMAFGVQGGDTQEQNLLQFFLNVVEFGMDPQEASEAANFNSYQLHSSFGAHVSEPGRLLLRADTPLAVQLRLQSMGYLVELARLTSGPINAIVVDQEQGTFIGGSSNFGDDYGIAW
jgi:gamma-glutamyltranspeptidase/glutathione hydrolase